LGLRAEPVCMESNRRRGPLLVIIFDLAPDDGQVRSAESLSPSGVRSSVVALRGHEGRSDRATAEAAGMLFST
jgi:hypothetical protein